MADSTERPESQWDQALVRALGTATDDDGICLFLEEREGLVVAGDSNGVSDATRSRSRGVSVRSSFEREQGVYLAEPQPDDLVRLTGAARGDPAGLPDRRSRSSAPPAAPRLDANPAAEFVSETVAEAGGLPGLWLEARWVAFVQEVTVARPGRPVAHDSRRGARVRVAARIARGSRAAMATVESIVAGEAGDLRAMIPRLARRVARRAEERLDALPAPRGRRTVTFAPGVGGIVAHELVGHALEADVVLGGGSWITELKENSGSTLTVVDDPRRGRAAWRVDDEGEPTRPTPLLRSGAVAGWLHDRHTAREAGRPPTGHGRRASFREEVKPRMGCTFIAPGDLEPEEVLDGIDGGVYVRRMESAGTDPFTGRAFFRVTDSDLIRDGRVDRPLQTYVLFLDGSEVVRNTRRIANDLTFDTCIGSCHRDGQALASSVGAPTICVGSGAVIS